MKKAIVQSVLVVLLVCGAASSVLADTHYAAQNGQTPSGTFTDWNSAASNIQDAVGQAANNDTVLIGAGHYTTTNGSVYGTSTNVVMISIAALTLSSSNGNPASVSIDGGGNKRGILLHSAGSATIPVVINGITISNCFISGANGGGIESDKTSGTQLVQNCVICDNITTWGGGGVDNTGGSAFMIISNCVVRHNQAGSGNLGGGIYGAQFVTLESPVL